MSDFIRLLTTEATDVKIEIRRLFYKDVADIITSFLIEECSCCMRDYLEEITLPTSEGFTICMDCSLSTQFQICQCCNLFYGISNYDFCCICFSKFCNYCRHCGRCRELLHHNFILRNSD